MKAEAEELLSIIDSEACAIHLKTTLKTNEAIFLRDGGNFVSGLGPFTMFEVLVRAYFSILHWEFLCLLFTSLTYYRFLFQKNRLLALLDKHCGECDVHYKYGELLPEVRV